MIAKKTKHKEIKQVVTRLAKLSDSEANQILYDYQLKKTMDERVLKRVAKEDGFKEGMKEGEIKKAIEDIVAFAKIGMSLKIICQTLNVDESIKQQAINELNERGIKYNK